MDKEHPDQKRQFDSRDIKPRQDINYFTKLRQPKGITKFFQKFKTTFLSGRRKFFTITFIAIIVVAAVVLIFFLATRDNNEIETPPAAISRSAIEVYNEAVAVSSTPAANAFSDALNIFDTAIAEADNEELKNEIIYRKSSFYQLYSAYQEATNILIELLNKDSLTVSQRQTCMISLISIYHSLGYDQEADELEEEFNQLYPSGDDSEYEEQTSEDATTENKSMEEDS